MFDDDRPLTDPLFDDEDLPEWLKKAGITYRGKEAAHFTGATVDFSRPPWETDATMLPDAETLETPDWMHAGEAPLDLDEDDPPVGQSVEVPAWMQVEAPPVPQSGILKGSGSLKKGSAPLTSPARATSRPSAPPTSPANPLSAGGEGDLGGGVPLPDPLPAVVTLRPEPPPPIEVKMPDPLTPNAPAGSGSDNFDDLRADPTMGNAADNADEFSALFENADDLFGTIAPEPTAPAAEPAEEIPDWMREMAAAPPIKVGSEDDFIKSLASVTPAATTWDAPESSNDVPDWMRGMAPLTASNPVDEMDWITGVPESTTPPADAATPAPSEIISGELPDWLSGEGDSFTSPEQAGGATEFPATGISPDRFAPGRGQARDDDDAVDIDALLNLPLTAPPSRSSPPPPLVASPVTPEYSLDRPSSMFTGLDEVSFEDTTIDEQMGPPSNEFRFADAAPDLPAADTSGQSAQPSLMAGNKLRKFPIKPADDPADLPDAEQLTGELPEFVQEMRPAGAPVELTIGGVQFGVKEEPISSLSDPLRQLRERTRQMGVGQAEDVTPTEGALAEIPGVLTTSAISMTAEAKALPAVQGIMTDMQGKRVRLIQSLLEVEEEAEKAVQKSRRRNRSFRLDRMFIAVMLFAVISVPFFTDVANVMTPPDTANLTPAQKAVFSVMDGFTSGQPVLMAFEYGPAGSGELDDLARVLLRDLFRKGSKPIIVSTNPAGAMHAESLLATFGQNEAELLALNRPGKPLIARADYVVLRYLPAGAAGVRSMLNGIYQGGFEAQAQFTTDIEGKPVGLSNDAIRALQRAPVILLAETPDDVRNWAEQYRPPGATPQKLLIAASVSADATAHTYIASRPSAFIGPLVGLRDATVYRLSRQANFGSPAELKLLDQRWQSTGLGALVAGFFILIGMTFSMIGAIHRRSRPVQEKSR